MYSSYCHKVDYRWSGPFKYFFANFGISLKMTSPSSLLASNCVMPKVVWVIGEATLSHSLHMISSVRHNEKRKKKGMIHHFFTYLFPPLESYNCSIPMQRHDTAHGKQCTCKWRNVDMTSCDPDCKKLNKIVISSVLSSGLVTLSPRPLMDCWPWGVCCNSHLEQSLQFVFTLSKLFLMHRSTFRF